MLSPHSLPTSCNFFLPNSLYKSLSIISASHMHTGMAMVNWSMGNLLGDIYLKKTDFSSPKSFHFLSHLVLIQFLLITTWTDINSSRFCPHYYPFIIYLSYFPVPILLGFEMHGSEGFVHRQERVVFLFC